MLAESNARAGVAIKSVARFARATATAFEDTGLPRAVVLGNPVRSSVLALNADFARAVGTGRATAVAAVSESAGSADHAVEDHSAGAADHSAGAADHSDVVRSASRRDLGVPEVVDMVSVFGGSLGARSINEAVFALCDQWRDRSMVLHHVIGERDYTDAQSWLKGFRERFPRSVLDYRQIRYEDRMDLVYGASDVVVCRAGATSIADLAIAGIPAILIPLPTAAEDHQSANARSVAACGASTCLPQAELSAERLGFEIDALLLNPEKRVAMATAQRQRARPRAALDIAELLRKYAARPEPRHEHRAEHGRVETAGMSS